MASYGTFYFEIIQIWIVRDRSGRYVVISACLAAGLEVWDFFEGQVVERAPSRI